MGSICKLKKGVEDYVWTRDGKLLIGFEGKLLMYDKAKPENGWTELVDFSKSVGKFYRIAISPQGNRLALVAVMDDVKKSDSTKEPEPTKEDKKKKKKRE